MASSANGVLAVQPSADAPQTKKDGNSSNSWTSNVRQSLRRLFPPINGKSLLRHYVPMSGALSHSLFTMHILAPSVFTRLFSVYDLAASNVVLFNAHLGLGFYLYFRPHMHRLWRWRRVEYSVLATILFNFGSLLMSIFVKDLLPQKLKQLPRSLIGICLSIFLLNRTRRYVQYVDQRAAILPAIAALELRNSTAQRQQQTPDRKTPERQQQTPERNTPERQQQKSSTHSPSPSA